MWQDSDSGQMGFWASWQKLNHLPGDGKAQQRKTKLGHSGQSPCPGSTDLYLLSVCMEIIGPGWLELKWKCWIAWGLVEPWVVKRSNRVLCKQGPKLQIMAIPVPRNWVLNRQNTTKMVCTEKQDDEATPLAYIDAPQNAVSVLGCMGEWSPWACPHQCMGWWGQE